MEIDCPAASADAPARAAVGWLTEARDALFPGLGPALATDPPAPGPDENNPRAAWGPANGVCAQLLVQRSARTPPRQSRFSPRRWRTLLASLDATDKAPPVRVSLLLHPLDPRGLPVDEEHALTVEYVWLAGGGEAGESGGWLRCLATAPESLLRQPDANDTQRRWLDALATWADRLDAAYAHLTDDADLEYGTALERVLHRWPEDTVPDSGRLLRGYSWTTVCSPDVAQQVGGADQLRASGAFRAVTELAAGRVLLQATERLEDYGPGSAARVLRALAPALPEGRTDAEYVYPWMRLVPDGDAADHR